MRGVILTACSLITLGLMGFACDNDPTVLPTGPTGPGGGGSNPTGMGGNPTTGGNGGDGNNDGGMGGIGGAAGGMGGAGGTIEIVDCIEDLGPLEGPLDIVISEVSIGNYIEVYNPTNDTKALGAIEYQAYRWCAQPSYPQFQSTAAGITVPPGSYRTIPWPQLNVGDNTNGELALYLDNDYGNSASVVDYVCWGNVVGGPATRKDEAEGAGEWGIDAACAAPTDNGVLRRLVNTRGSAAAAWDSTAVADPTNCDQP